MLKNRVLEMRDLHREKSRDLQRIPFEDLAETDQHMHMRKLPTVMESQAYSHRPGRNTLCMHLDYSERSCLGSVA